MNAILFNMRLIQSIQAGGRKAGSKLKKTKERKMTEFETFWQTYPSDLCNRKASKKEAQKVWDKIPESEYDKILINLRELMRVDRKVKKMGEFVARWPMVATWLRQERWNDIADIRQSQDMPTDTRSCTCGNPIAVVDQCNDCYDRTHEIPFAKELRDSFRKNAIKPEAGQSVADAHRQWWQQKRGVGGLTKKLAG